MKKKAIFFFLILTAAAATAQVNLQTGAPQHSISLLNYADGKSGLSASVALSYTGGNGIKVSQLAANTGLGWTLISGGFIQREQRGEPDDQYNANEGSGFTPYDPYVFNLTTEQNVYPNGYLYSSYSPDDNIPGSAAYTPMFTAQDRNYKLPASLAADREMDIFSFIAGGRVIKFVIGKNWVVKTLNDAKIKVEVFTADMSGQNIRTKINKFIITDESGIKYHFDKLELTEVTIPELSYSGAEAGCTTNFAPDPYSPTDILGRYFLATGIGRYTVNNWHLGKIENPATNEKIQFNYTTKSYNYITERDYQYSQEGSTTGGLISIYEHRNISSTPIPSEIIFPDNSRCTFTYSTHMRYDLANDSPLEKISFLDAQGNKVYAYKFEYGYFFNNQVADLNYSYANENKKLLRLCLKSVQKEGKDNSTIPKTTFEYNLGTMGDVEYTIPDRLSYFKDYWGYINSESYNNNLACNSLTSQLLQYTKYGYNTRYSQLKCGGGLLRKVKNPSGGSIEWLYDNSAQVLALNPNDAFYGCRVKEVVETDDISAGNTLHTTYKYNLESSTYNSGWGLEQPSNLRTSQSRIWKSQQQVYAGQIIKQILRDYLIGKNGIAEFIVSQIVQYIIYTFTDDYKDKTMNLYNQYSPVISNPLPFQYARVEVQQTGTNANGKTVYEFTSPQHFALLSANFQFPYAMKQRAIQDFYGLPKKVTVYNASGSMVNKTEYSYNFDNQALQGSNYKSLAWSANRYNYMNNNSRNIPVENIPSSEVTTEAYSTYVSKVKLTQTKETSYNPDNTSFEIVSNFEYNTSNNQLKKISRLNSKNELLEKITYYPGDYNISGHVTADMITNNMNNYPVSSETWITKAGAQKYLVDLNIINYVKLANNEIKPAGEMTLESAEPVPYSTIGDFNPSVLNRNTGLIKPQKTFAYDPGTGLLLENAWQNKKTSFIYAYNNRHVVATILNAGQQDIAYTSFESDDAGGWSFSPAAVSDHDFVTGKKVFRLINPSLGQSYQVSKSNLNASTQYVVTLWMKDGDVSVNGSSGTMLYRNKEWFLMKYDLSAVTSVTITGTAIIDELRLYPKDALMSTVTYDSYFGKTSECDANNRIVYYEYDALGRLKLMRDDKWNVLKTYEYNYKQ